MPPVRRSAALSLLAAVPLLLSNAALVLGAPEPARYILTDLTERRSQATAINAQGDVAGWMETDGRWTAFLYRHESGELVDVGRHLLALYASQPYENAICP